MVRILFINAVDPYSTMQRRYPNLGLAYLAASLRKHFGPKIFGFKISDGIGALDTFKPHLVGITCVSQNYEYARQYAKEAKKRGLPVIIGGVHISALPQTMTEDMDVAVIGEGEETICQIVGIILGDHPNTTPGVGVEICGQIRLSLPRPLIDPIDKIPFPARDLLKIGRQSNIFSSRGCPYRCTFCFSSRYWSKVRFFSAEYVAEELREMYALGVRRVNFYDDLMIADIPRLYRLVGLIRRDPKLSKLKFFCNARANLVTDETARLLQEMGVVSVGMGLESGCERTLRYLKGGSVSVADNYRAVKILHKYGIAANASFVIGSPDETREEILRTYRFISKSGLDFADTFVLVPFPGTPVWEDAIKRGLVSDKMDWGRLNVYFCKQGDPIIVSNRVGRDEMASLYHKFRRQRLYIAAKKAWFHPYFWEFLRAGGESIINGVHRICRKSA